MIKNDPPQGVSQLRWNFLLWKRYFETGMAQTNFMKYVVAIFGVTSQDMKSTAIIGGVYVVFCFAIGYIWFKKKFAEVDNEISNRFNPFMGEMREMKDHVTKNERQSSEG